MSVLLVLALLTTGTVTVPSWLLSLMIVVSGAIGYASCYFGVVKIGTAVARSEMNPRNTPWVPIVTLVASAMVITMGVMYWLESRAQDQEERKRAAVQMAYDHCLTEWGDALVAGFNSRSIARKMYDNAKDRRDDAGDDVFAAALYLIVHPQANGDLLKEVLLHAQRAAHKVDQARLALDSATTAYVPPTLACSK